VGISVLLLCWKKQIQGRKIGEILAVLRHALHATTVEDRILMANREVSPYAYGVRKPKPDAAKNSVLCMKRSCPKRIQLECGEPRT
jgi:hypothetical protein